VENAAMSTDINFPDFNNMDEDQAKSFVQAFHAKNRKEKLEDKTLEKLERERRIQENIFKKMGSGEISSAPASEMVGTVPPFQPPPTSIQPLMEKTIEEDNIPFTRVTTLKSVGSGAASSASPVRPTEPIRVTQQLNREAPTKATPVNDENEPTGIQWRPTTVQQLIALYPKAQAVSDLWMTLHGAAQQPGMAFGLIAPHGTKYFVKADKNGSLFMADPDPNPKAFANVGLNPDMDNDKVDDAAGIDPAKPFNQNSHRVLPTRLESKNDFGVDVNFNELSESRIDLSTIEDEKTRKVVEKLYKEADELRAKDKEEKKPLNENVKEDTYTLKQLSSMLMKAQTKVMNTRSKLYEAVAEELSDVIAEALLENRNTVPVSRISKVVRNIKW
jgi:hypothetical protein